MYKETGSGTVGIALALPISTGIPSTVSALNSVYIEEIMAECREPK
jgi:hypothetical protein